LLRGRVLPLSRSFEKNSEKPLFFAREVAGKWPCGRHKSEVRRFN
jgi:hypothetical protein